jgi:hypothetical protein
MAVECVGIADMFGNFLCVAGSARRACCRVAPAAPALRATPGALCAAALRTL